MKFYLSAQRMGREVGRLKRMLPKNRKTAYIPNAMDFLRDSEERRRRDQRNIRKLEALGLDVEVLDLREYFGKARLLERRLAGFGVIWVRGGSVFVLRQAMRLSGFDRIFSRLVKKGDILYGGYSAGVCILAPSLHGIDLMDDVKLRPYGRRSKLIWEGLGVLDYQVVPHYRSDHPETKKAEKAVQYYIDNKVLFKALRNGEVIIIE